jgi:hypothetical protein
LEVETVPAEKPKDIAEYKKWLRDRHSVDITSLTQSHYETFATLIRAAFENSPFWQDLTPERKLRDFQEEYLLSEHVPLFFTPKRPELECKSWERFLSKTFRLNVVDNRNWEDPPQGPDYKGWVLPRDWLEKINDVVRTRFYVKYFDGVAFLIDRLKVLCEDHNLDCDHQLEARMDGYYAGHLYVRYECEVPKIVEAGMQKLSVKVEFQVNTQLQEVIGDLLHKRYEEKRESPKRGRENWQWDFASKEFRTNYLAHILHYLEGVIVANRKEERT